MRLVILAYILKLETLRQVEIPLHRSELPEATDGVFDLEVNLWTIERALALDALVLDAVFLQNSRELVFGLRPFFVRAEIVLVRLIAFDGQLELNLLEPERLQDRDDEINAVADLLAHLIGRAEEMRVVNRKPAHAHQPVQRA